MARPLLVILSAAKDLMPVAIGDEILRCAQDDSRDGSGTRPRLGLSATFFPSNRSRDARISLACARAHEPSGSTAFHKVLPSLVNS
jgi:hypothetical protein